MFKLFKRKLSAEKTITKEEFRQHKQAIDKWVTDYVEQTKLKVSNAVDEANKDIKYYNDYCEKCQHQDTTVNKFVKKGVSVFKYNHCNNCGHEWKYKEELEYKKLTHELLYSVVDFLEDVVSKLIYFSYDPSDITNEYDSKEEAYLAKLNSIKNQYNNIIKDIPLEVMHYICYNYACGHVEFMNEIFDFAERNHTITFNSVEHYMGKFSKDLERILINDFDVKKIFIN